jgi:dTMP kinase
MKAAYRFFKRRGCAVVLLREPGSTKVGEAIRRVLLDRKHTRMSVSTELFLYLAARGQIAREKIWPALQQGKIVICDRFHDSTVAYQGFGGGISLSVIRKMEGLATAGLKPKLTFLLDVKVQKGLRRSGRKDRMEQKPFSFHEKVRRGFLYLARKEPGRIVLIRDQKTIEAKRRVVEKKLEELFS